MKNLELGAPGSSEPSQNCLGSRRFTASSEFLLTCPCLLQRAMLSSLQVTQEEETSWESGANTPSSQDLRYSQLSTPISEISIWKKCQQAGDGTGGRKSRLEFWLGLCFCGLTGQSHSSLWWDVLGLAVVCLVWATASTCVSLLEGHP